MLLTHAGMHRISMLLETGETSFGGTMYRRGVTKVFVGQWSSEKKTRMAGAGWALGSGSVVMP
jgi:hypothetical protein